MRNVSHSKLIYFLSLFGSADRRAFRDFIHSPVFNKREEPRLLYEYIEKRCLGKSIKEINDDQATKAIWPKGAPAAGKLEKVKSLLVNLLMDFFEFRSWQRKSDRMKAGLLEELNILDEESYFQQYYKKARKSVSLDDGQDLTMYGQWLEIEIQYTVFLMKHGIRTSDNHMAETIDAVERVLLGHLLKFAYVAENQSKIVGKQLLPEWIKAAADEISEAQVAGQPLLELYYWLYQTMNPGAEPAHLEQLKALVLNHAQHCSAAEAYNIYTGAINNFSRQSPLVGQSVLTDIFDLYKSMVDIYTRKMGNRLVPWHFKSIVYIGSRLGHFEWVQQLLEEGDQLLLDKGKALKTALAYNGGVFHFYKGEYEACEAYFHKVLTEARDVFYASDARAFLLMAYYEIGNDLGMESLVHSFRMFLSRAEKVSETHKHRYLEFIRVYRRLLATPPNDAVRLQQLKADIDALKYSAGKIWFQQKYAALVD